MADPAGWRHLAGYLSRDQQAALLAGIRTVISGASLYPPTMPRTGKPFSVRMTNCGTLGWVSDATGGYRYQATHPVTGQPWPPMPTVPVKLWDSVTSYPAGPEACLVNFYSDEAKLGLHQDRDEDEFAAPVVSVSLGDSCLFRVGENVREGRTTSMKLKSGDVVILGGDGRLAFHGVDRIYPATSALLRNGGRINLTLRRVTRPA